MKHIFTLLDERIPNKQNTELCLPLARQVGYYASILYCYLVDKNGDVYNYRAAYNVREGVRWLPQLPERDILGEMRIFPDGRTITRAADELETAGLIRVERTGKFYVAKGFGRSKARDKWPWWHVDMKNMPAEFMKPKPGDFVMVSSVEAAAYGMAGAVLLAHCRSAKVELLTPEADYKKLSAVELAKILPMDERTVRRQLKGLLVAGALIQHPTKPKLYYAPDKPITSVVKVATHQPREALIKRPLQAVDPLSGERSCSALLSPVLPKPDLEVSTVTSGGMAFLSFHAA